MIATPLMHFGAAIALLLSLHLTVVALNADDLEKVRTWTSIEGATLRANLLRIDAKAKTARMRRDDGRIFTIAWNRLSDADQARLQSSIQPQPQPQPEPRSTRALQTTTANQPLPKKFKLRKVPMIQQKSNFCVPASAAMIAGYHNIKTDQDEVAQLSSKASISNQGTYPSDMLLAMQKLGFEGRSLLWRDTADFEKTALPAIRRALVDTGPVYISFRPGVFGDMGHGCVIIGYNDGNQEMVFHNPWGNVFEKEYADVAIQGRGVVFIKPPKPAPSASNSFIEMIQQHVPHFNGDMIQLSHQLKQAEQPFQLVWCSRRDSRDDKHFAVNTARRDGRKILELAFERNPAVLIPASPNGQTEHYLFVTRPPQGGASFMVREITKTGWSRPELKTLGSLTRAWATELIVPGYSVRQWELPMIELCE